MKLTRTLMIFALLGLTLSGCDAAKDLLGGDDDGQAAKAVSSSELTRTEAALVVVTSEGLDLTKTSEELAADIAAAAKTTFSPAECVDAEVTGSVVGYNFDKCTGPLGLAELNGQMSATVGITGTELTINLTSTNQFSSDAATMTLSAQSTISTDMDGVRTITLATGGGGTLDDGTVVTRAGQYMVTSDAMSDCVEVDGAWTTTIGSDSFVTTVSDYKICGADGCPESGGNLTYVGSSDDTSTVTIQFDGSAKPPFSTTDNLTPRTIDLSCTP